MRIRMITKNVILGYCSNNHGQVQCKYRKMSPPYLGTVLTTTDKYNASIVKCHRRTWVLF
jgi:hypothetical protein